MHIALEYQRHTSLIHDWQKKRDSIEITRKLSQELAPSVSHDSHMTNEGSTTDLSTNELKLPQVKPHPQLSALSSDEPHSISPDSGTDIDIRSNHGNIVMEPEEVSTAREEVATLVAEKHRLEARHKRMQIQLQEAKTKMMEVKEVSGGFILREGEREGGREKWRKEREIRLIVFVKLNITT